MTDDYGDTPYDDVVSDLGTGSATLLFDALQKWGRVPFLFAVSESPEWKQEFTRAALRYLDTVEGCESCKDAARTAFIHYAAGALHAYHYAHQHDEIHRVMVFGKTCQHAHGTTYED